MLCPVLGWHCLAGAEGRAALPCFSQTKKALGGFFSGSNLLWAVLGHWPDLQLSPHLAVPACPLQESPGGAGAGYSSSPVVPLTSLTASPAGFYFSHCAVMSKGEGAVCGTALQPRYPGQSQQETSSELNTAVLSPKIIGNMVLTFPWCVFRTFTLNKTTCSPEHKATELKPKIFKPNRINEAEWCLHLSIFSFLWAEMFLFSNLSITENVHFYHITSAELELKAKNCGGLLYYN